MGDVVTSREEEFLYYIKNPLVKISYMKKTRIEISLKLFMKED